MYEFEDFEIVRAVTVRVYDYEPSTSGYRRGHPDNWTAPDAGSLDCEAVGADGTVYALSDEDKRDVVRAIEAELERQWDAHAGDAFDLENDR